MFKKIIITVAILLVVLGPITGLKVFQIANLISYAQAMQAAGMPPSPVATAPVQAQDWEIVLRSVGSLRPVQGVTLAAELGGKVIDIPVENGASVEAGEVLVQLDTEIEEARLAAAEANARLARINIDRARGLIESGTISQAEFDAADAAFSQAEAEMTNIRATIAKKTIRAPFAGRVGIRLVNLGQTLNPGDPIIPLQALDPIFADFNIAQQRLADLAVGQTVRVTVGGLADPVSGRVTAINPVVDATTRTVQVQATLANPDERLRAGMFARVEVILPQVDQVLAIPLTAVTRAPYGDSVFVVEEKDGQQVVRKQFVRLGATRGDFVAVLDGLQAGQRVVSAGSVKLQDGAAITANDEMQPPASLTPQYPNA